MSLEYELRKLKEVIDSQYDELNNIMNVLDARDKEIMDIRIIATFLLFMFLLVCTIRFFRWFMNEEYREMEELRVEPMEAFKILFIYVGVLGIFIQIFK